jgi:hypothetical protein
VSSLPEYYASTIDLPFNRACLDDQFVLQCPDDDPGGLGYVLLLQGNTMLAEKTSEGVKLPCGEGPGLPELYLGLWQGKPCRLVDCGNVGALRGHLGGCRT